MIQILNILPITKRNRWGKLFQLANFCKTLQAKTVGKVFPQCKYLSNAYVNKITMIDIKRAIVCFIIIALIGYIERTFAVNKKTLSISLFPLKLKKLALCNQVV